MNVSFPLKFTTLLCIRYRYKRKRMHSLRTLLILLGNYTLKLTNHLHVIYSNKFISQNEYNNYMKWLEETNDIHVEIYEKLGSTLQLNTEKYTNVLQVTKFMTDRLRHISRRIGTPTIHGILELELGIHSIDKVSDWWTIFLNTAFVPLNYKIYRLTLNTEGKTCITESTLAETVLDSKNSKSKRSSSRVPLSRKKGKKKSSQTQIVITNRKSIDPIPVQNFDDVRIQGFIDTNFYLTTEKLTYLLQQDKSNSKQFFADSGSTTLPKQSVLTTGELLGGNTQFSLIKSIYGARVYLPFLSQNIIFAISGYFLTDSFQTAFNHQPLRTKHYKLCTLLSQNSIVAESFSHGWIKLLTIRDLLVYNANELCDRCIQDFQRLQNYKQKTISRLVKEFLSSSHLVQRDILTLFLLTDQDSDAQYLAYLMYDMISQESYLLKPQPLAEEIYNHLHWHIKKRFKVVIENMNDFTKKLSTLVDPDINYESRICLMKAPDAVKKKALEKLKEVQSKGGNETNHKAQQYLDGILRIPFGIYRRERIFAYLDEFSKRVQTYCTQKCVVQSQEHSPVDPLIQKILTCVKDQRRLTFDCIETFLNRGSLPTDISHAHNTTSSHSELWSDVHHTLLKHDYQTLKKTISICKKQLGVKSLVYTEGKKQLRVRVSARDGGKVVKLDTKTIVQELVRYLQFTHKHQSQNWHICRDVWNLQQQQQQQQQTSNESVTTINQHQIEVMKTEWTQFKEYTRTYLKSVDDILEQSVFGHAKAKRSIKQVIAQWITGDLKGYCFGFEGPPGTGKTSLAKNGLSKCLVDINGEKRPFCFIALGGSCNGSTLEGHSYTYVGSIWGRIVDILMETECLNPIIYIDELDKVSRTEHGKELIGILTHITDSTQNEEFMDKYFSGIKLDLSRVLFVFSYNDPDLIDPILRDRIHVVRFSPLRQADKHEVCGRHLIPEILKTVGLANQDITFPKDVIDFIIDHYTAEGGVRRLKEKLFEICRDVNIRHMSEPQKYAFPYVVSSEFLKNDLFVEHPIVHRKHILEVPRVGLVNGMYATSLGVGGITIIECFIVPKSSFMALELTGHQGDVMKESMSVAKTVAWNLLSEETKTELWSTAKANSIGLHVHCPDGGTPKDGPSAGTAITISMLSGLLKCPVNNKVAITGEIDLNGEVCQIGGLDTKVRGAKKAGVTTVLFPKSNAHDLQSIKKHYNPFDDHFKFVMVETIWDVLPYVFPGLSYKFTRF